MELAEGTGDETGDETGEEAGEELMGDDAAAPPLIVNRGV